MKNRICYCLMLFSLILFSCSQNVNEQVTKSWKVVKMEKIVKVMSNSYTPINIDINKNMSYHFLSNERVELTTQSGTKLKGLWSKKDSIININIKGEVKKFRILKLTDKKLIMMSDKFKFYLESK
ncbi:hypothetical protein [uncultured Aquimarina sp.]|uniref:hypothetical protein n=1 Tax=uncultured Aquimarina sp. TaxID=575652 RepID=UPI00261AC3B0|nr:hypothetical protein [uncultured Aquimarina sp.]